MNEHVTSLMVLRTGVVTTYILTDTVGGASTKTMFELDRLELAENCMPESSFSLEKINNDFSELFASDLEDL